MKTIFPNQIFTGLIALFALVCPALSQIEAGTSVQIAIMGVPSEEKGRIDGLYPVSESGTINLPFVNKIRAAGLSPENLAVVIQNAYKAAEIYNNPTFQVISTVAGSSVLNQVVTMGGQVGRTGPIPWNKDLTLYGAIQGAGGAGTFGSLRRVTVYRDGKITIYDVTEPENMNIPLKPNDTVEVPQKNWFGR
jgi:protein involved in polysaccharide export with SLBB domain